jgi:DnaJ-like protein
MDYYQELGITRTASVEEIRRSYKRLARLIHPDRCGYDSARTDAEQQMKRLNAIKATLLDPMARLRYDLELSDSFALSQRPTPAPKSRFWPAWGAILAAALALGCAYLKVEPRSEAKSSARPVPQPAAPIAIPRKMRQPRPQQIAYRAVVPPPAPLLEATPRISPVISAEPLIEFEPIPVVKEVVPPPPAATDSTLAGDWLFVAPRHTGTFGLYPPEYIELRITESSGVLRGRYRARYRVADRAISPNVAFQFETRREAAGFENLPWAGLGNARGQVNLRLLPAGALEVSWLAEQMGTELGLISGTATLVRKLD